jgi:predicted nucleic acid-binding protein
VAAAASARPLVHDTVVYLQLLRRGERLLSRPSERIYVSAVVLAELYAGARTSTEARTIDALGLAAARTGRLLVPNTDDWQLAGQLLERRGRLEGRLEIRDHLADLLIVLSASQVGARVATLNVRHFEAWAALARRAGRNVVVAA